MNLEDLGNIGEFVGAIAVVLSLVYLALQIRQNTRATRAEISQGLAVAAASALQETGRDPQASHVFLTGLRDYGSLSEGEKGQFRLLMVGAFLRFENVHYQHRSGTIEKDHWPEYQAHIRVYVESRGVRSYWEEFGGNFSAPFQGFINDLISTIEAHPTARSESPSPTP